MASTYRKEKLERCLREMIWQLEYTEEQRKESEEKDRKWLVDYYDGRSAALKFSIERFKHEFDLDVEDKK